MAAGHAGPPRRRPAGAAALGRRRHRAPRRRHQPPASPSRRSPRPRPPWTPPSPATTPRWSPPSWSACSTTPAGGTPCSGTTPSCSAAPPPPPPCWPPPTRRALRVLTTYGMSETAGGCVYDGEPLACSRVRIEADGRILLGGDTLASGYLGRPDLDRARSSPATARAGGGSAPTTSATSTADGRLVVDGRVDDVINTGGVKVAPRQVEDALLDPRARRQRGGGRRDAGPGVGRGGRRRRRPARRAGRRSTVGEVRAALRGVLPGPALPRRVVAVASIPVRGPGKPDRREIRRILVGAATYDRVRTGTEGGAMLAVVRCPSAADPAPAGPDHLRGWSTASRPRSRASATCPRSLWLLLILLFPLVGPIAWFLAGRPGPAPAPSGHRQPAARTRVAPTTTPTSSVTCDSGRPVRPSPELTENCILHGHVVPVGRGRPPAHPARRRRTRPRRDRRGLRALPRQRRGRPARPAGLPRAAGRRELRERLLRRDPRHRPRAGRAGAAGRATARHRRQRQAGGDALLRRRGGDRAGAGGPERGVV